MNGVVGNPEGLALTNISYRFFLRLNSIVAKRILVFVNSSTDNLESMKADIKSINLVAILVLPFVVPGPSLSNTHLSHLILHKL